MKLPADDEAPGQAAGRSSTTGRSRSRDAEALAAQKLNAEVGTKIAEARRLQETDPDKAIAIYEQTLKAVKAAGLSPEPVARTMVRRLEVAIELAKKDKVAFDVKMQDKTAAGRDRAQAAPHPRGRQGQEGPHEGADGQGPGRLRRGRATPRPRPTPRGPWRSTPTRSPPTMLAFKAQDRAPLQAGPGDQGRQGRTAPSPPSRRSTSPRSPTPRSSSTASSSPRTSRT